MLKSIIATLALVVAAGPAWADEFVPGRPGNTESPISVPAGRWQVESELGGFARGHGARSLSLLATDVRFGLAPGWDAEAIVTPYLEDRLGGDAEAGAGDTTLRLRHTFAGQDGEGPAFALIAYVTAPTATNGRGDGAFEGGLIAAGTFDLSEADGVTYTLGAAAVSDAGDYKADVYGGINLTHQFTDRIAAYAEAFADCSGGETAATLDLGATYLSDAHTQWDVGVDLGVSDAADDMRAFIGWAHLF